MTSPDRGWSCLHSPWRVGARGAWFVFGIPQILGQEEGILSDEAVMDPPAAQVGCAVSAVTHHVDGLGVNGLCDHVPVVGDVLHHLT